MHGPLEAVKECGWAAFLAIFVGAAGVAVGVIGLVLLATRSRSAAWIPGAIAVLLGLGAVAAGVVGRQIGMSRVEEFVSSPSPDIDPHQRQMMLELGTMEANQCVKVGFTLGALPFVLGLVAVGLGLAVGRRPPPSPEG